MGASPSSTQQGWSRRRRFSFQRQPTRLIWLWRPLTFCCWQAHAQVHGTNTESVFECCKHAHTKHSQVAWTSGRAEPVGGHRAIQSKGFLVPGPGLFENPLEVRCRVRHSFRFYGSRFYRSHRDQLRQKKKGGHRAALGDMSSV